MKTITEYKSLHYWTHCLLFNSPISFYKKIPIKQGSDPSWWVHKTMLTTCSLVWCIILCSKPCFCVALIYLPTILLFLISRYIFLSFNSLVCVWSILYSTALLFTECVTHGFISKRESAQNKNCVHTCVFYYYDHGD